MSRARARRCGTYPVLALFLLISVTPRAVLFSHHHAGGDHDHVHPWGEDAAESHHHDHPETGALELEEPDDHHEHVHIQVPFQLALQPTPIVVFVGWLVRPVDAPIAVATGVTLLPDPLARGPPALLAS